VPQLEGFIRDIQDRLPNLDFVKDIIMPPIGLALGNVDFTNLFVVLKQGTMAGPYASLSAA
jgi:hypothetical protein